MNDTIQYQQTERNASGLVAYPLNRAQRIEFSAGVTQLTFEPIVWTTAFSLHTGRIYVDDAKTTAVAPSLNLATSTAAVVSDTSLLRCHESGAGTAIPRGTRPDRW